MVDHDRGNPYDDPARAASYAGLEFPGTYYLAYRDLPDLIARHAGGVRALDFGCGAGRSTRFLRGLGFSAVGVDISAPMIDAARARDPDGDYRVVPPGNLTGLPAGGYDLILSVFPFDNIATTEIKAAIFRGLRSRLAAGGAIINVSAAPAVYVNEWVSFSTRDFPGNRFAANGDPVSAVMLDGADRRPVTDVLWTDEGRREVYRAAGLTPVETCRPLGRNDEPFPWVTERTISPWQIDVLQSV